MKVAEVTLVEDHHGFDRDHHVYVENFHVLDRSDHIHSSKPFEDRVHFGKFDNDDDDDNKSNLLRIWQSLAISQVGHHWQVDPSPPFPFGNLTISAGTDIGVAFRQILFSIFQCGILVLPSGGWWRQSPSQATLPQAPSQGLITNGQIWLKSQRLVFKF